MVKVACPACAKVLRFQEKYLGRKIHCPQCGHPQVLGQPADDDDTQGPPVASSVAGTPKPNRSESFATQTPMTLAINEKASGGSGRLAGVAFPGSFLAPPQAPDEIGRLGPYRVLSQLGAGGMGVVFLAEDVALNRKIALKALPPDANDDPAARDRFIREARAASGLEHENIITVHQVGEDRGVMYLAMPLLKGRPLDQYLYDNGGRPLPLGEVLQIGREIAAGLSAAHEAGVVHRDIKPANIWLEDMAGRSSNRESYRVKILDFGLARRKHDAGLTQSGIIVGTPSYMSPEQARSPNVDARSDLFSLGCVLFEISTGRRPFAGDDAIAVLSSLAADIPLPPAEVNPDIPFEVSDLILELLEKNPDHRPATAQDVEERIRDLQAGSIDSSSSTQKLPASRLRSPRPPAAPSLRWIWIAASAAVACVAIVVIGWTIVASQPPPPAPKEKDAKNPKANQKAPRPVDDVQFQPPFLPLPPPPHDDEKKRLDDEEKARRDAEKIQKDAERDDKDRKKKDGKDGKDPFKKKKGPDFSFYLPTPDRQPALERWLPAARPPHLASPRAASSNVAASSQLGRAFSKAIVFG